MPTPQPPHTAHPDPDVHKGSLEGDRPEDEQVANRNAPALDEKGMPSNERAIAEDVEGANQDETQG